MRDLHFVCRQQIMSLLLCMWAPLKAEVNKFESVCDVLGNFSQSFSHYMARVGKNMIDELTVTEAIGD